MMAGDAFLVLVEALKNGDSQPTSAKLGDYLHNRLKGFSGFTGPIAFDAKGDRVGEVYRLYQVDAAGNFVIKP